MPERSISVYKKDVEIIKVPEDNISDTREPLPFICVFGESVGVATEYIEDEKSYLVDISKTKIFSCRDFTKSELPNEVGDLIYVNNLKLTGKKDGSTLVGIYLGLKDDVVFFMLK